MLLSYEYIPAGYEMVVSRNEVRTWGLWFNVSLSDDPTRWDAKVHALNARQRGLGALTDGQRLVRAHMAEFCRWRSVLPDSIELLCREIGAGDLIEPTALGCEGRGLLDAAAGDRLAVRATQEAAIYPRYAQALRRWMESARPEGGLERKVWGFLGAPTAERGRNVAPLLSALEQRAGREALKPVCETLCREARGQALFERAPRPFNCFTCDDWAQAAPRCGCAGAMLVDSALLSLGEVADRDAMGRLARRYIEEYVLAYAMALNGWLTGTTPDSAWTAGAHFVDTAGAHTVAESVGAALGERDEVKTWLVGCLLKTAAGNQRWHQHAELIDEYPQATSWLWEVSR